MRFRQKEENKFAFKKYYSRGQRTYAERVRRRLILRRALLTVGLIAVFVLGYFIMAVLLNISALPPT